MIVGVVRYWDLGRTKAKGKFKVVAKDDKEFNDKLYNEFSKHLISSNIAFDADSGTIFAGFHTVGKFEFIAKRLKDVI